MKFKVKFNVKCNMNVRMRGMQLTIEVHVKMKTLFVIFGLLSSILAHNSGPKLVPKSIYFFNI
jgi:hypothetical protein